MGALKLIKYIKQKYEKYMSKFKIQFIVYSYMIQV